MCERDECQLTNRTMYVCVRCDIFSQSEMMLRSSDKGLDGKFGNMQLKMQCLYPS